MSRKIWLSYKCFENVEVSNKEIYSMGSGFFRLSHSFQTRPDLPLKNIFLQFSPFKQINNNEYDACYQRVEFQEVQKLWDDDPDKDALRKII